MYILPPSTRTCPPTLYGIYCHTDEKYRHLNLFDTFGHLDNVTKEMTSKLSGLLILKGEHIISWITFVEQFFQSHNYWYQGLNFVQEKNNAYSCNQEDTFCRRLMTEDVFISRLTGTFLENINTITPGLVIF